MKSKFANSRVPVAGSTLLMVMFLLLSSIVGRSQCSTYGTIDYSSSGTVYHLDTTLLRIYADSTGFSSGSTYVWHFDDGTTQTGSTVFHPFTTDVSTRPTFTYTLTATDASTACTASFDNSGYSDPAPAVFNCSYFGTFGWDTYGLVSQPDLNDPASIMVNLYTLGAYSTSTLNITSRVHLDWGNGRIVDSNYTLFGTGGYATIGRGWSSDTVTSSMYKYGGEYTVSAAVTYIFGSLTCPVLHLPNVTIWADGPVAPLFVGATTICAGDTLRIAATDSTTRFHNLRHHTDTTGSGTSGIYFNGGISAPDWQEGDRFFWYNQAGDMLSGFDGLDSTLTLNNMSIYDSGTYYFEVFNVNTYSDFFYPFHVVVSGIHILTDSFSNPSCGTPNGNIYMRCSAPGASLVMHYQLNGVDSTMSLTADTHGVIVMSGLQQGRYGHFQVFPASGGCGSNLLNSTLTLSVLPVPVLTDTALEACSGGSVTLHASSPVSGATYSWAGPGGFTSTMASPTVTSVATSGIYSIAIHSGSCSSAPAFVHVTMLTAPPTITGSIAVPDSFCLGTNQNLGFGTGTWSVSDTTILWLGPHFVSGFTAGAATITYAVTNACGTSIVTKTLLVKNAPAVAAITGPAALCMGDTTTFHSSPSGGTWSLYYPAYPAPFSLNATTGHATATATGSVNIKYTVTSANGCQTDAYKIETVGRPRIDFVTEHAGVYPGYSITMSAYAYGGTTGGTWSGMASTVASISSAGVVTAYSVGAETVTITAGNACGADTFITQANVGDWINTDITRSNYNNSISFNDTDIAPENVSAFDRGQDGDALGMAFDTSGNLFFTEDYPLSKVRKIDRSGIVTTVAGLSIASNRGYGGDGGQATLARLNQPNGITVDRAGNIYFCDEGNHLVRKIDRSGMITTIGGVYTTSAIYTVGGYSGDGGPATAARLNDPQYIAVDTAGNIYITDVGNFRVRKINASGIITTIAGNGTSAYTGDGGPATAASLEYMGGITLDHANNILFVSGGRIRKIDPSGIITTFSGITGATLLDGSQASATGPVYFGNIAVDKTGNIYAGDGYDMKKIDTTGIVSRVMGGFYGASIANTAIDYNVSIKQIIYRGGYGFTTDDSGNVYYAYSNIVKAGKPELYITASAGSVCSGASLTFTANGHNTGRTPYYQWIKNGVNVGTDTAVFTASGLATGDTISCKVYNIIGGYYLCRSNAINIVISTGPSLGAITGTASFCVGDTATLFDTTSGGTWSSNDTTIARVSAGGLLTAIAAGTVMISYSKTDGCGTTHVTRSVTVNSAPAAATITGASTVCVGATTTLTTSVSGGAWTSGTSALATITSGGIVTGIAAGIDTISYAVTNVCGTTVTKYTVTILPLPSAGSISGGGTVCVGSTTTLTSSASGGTWTSGSTSVATISTSGIVSAVGIGTDTLHYSVTNSCGTAVSNAVINVLTTPSAGTISGVTSICTGASAALSASVSGGTWSSGSAAILTVSSSGAITGVNAGTATISYVVTNICGTATATITITVSPLPAAGTISGATSVCPGATTALSSTTAGGTWTSSATGIATVNSSGVVTGVTTGTATITYTVTNTCGTDSVATIITVIPLPFAGVISGTTTIPAGATTTLTNTVTTGTWTSSATAIATIDAAGVVSGVSPGTTIISYTVTNSCGTSSDTLLFTVTHDPTSLQGYSTGNTIEIYPNPATDNLDIQWTEKLTNDITIIITDVAGRTVFTKNWAANSTAGKITTNITSLEPGVYLVTFRSGAVKYVGKIVKE